MEMPGKTCLFFKGGFLHGIGLNKENIVVHSNKVEYRRNNIFKPEYLNESGYILSFGSTCNITENSALGIEFRFEHSGSIPASWNNPISNNNLIATISYHFSTK